MSTPKYTAGPWYYGLASESIITASGEEIASLADSDLAEKEDNAKLIAAAPEMLAALKAFHPSLCKTPGDLARAWESAKEIITRATA